MKLASRIAVVVLPAALLLGACGSSSQGTAAPAETSAPSVTTTQSTATSSASPTSRASSTAASSSVAPPKVMPDYVGQELSDVQAALAQYNVQIKTVNRIDAQPAGTVIDQDPVAGALFAQVVTLTVSTAPASVPDVTGKSFSAADEQLTRLGFAVKENPIFDQQKADGLVTGQNPPAGTGNAAEVTLDVVRRPVVTYLADMTAVATDGESDLEAGAEKANGNTYSHGLLIDPTPRYSSNELAIYEYDFSRAYRKLTGELGMDDASASGAIGKVEIYGDGRLLTQVDVPFGTTVPVDLDVTNVLRLKVTVAVLDGGGSIVFGDFAAQGLQSEVSASGSATPTTTSR
ncbi:MAG TPA: PASTA domain-containing protein [Nakamurella sp.]